MELGRVEEERRGERRWRGRGEVEEGGRGERREERRSERTLLPERDRPYIPEPFRQSCIEGGDVRKNISFKYGVPFGTRRVLSQTAFRTTHEAPPTSFSSQGARPKVHVISPLEPMWSVYILGHTAKLRFSRR